MTTVVSGGVKTFLLNHGQVKHLTSIFIPSHKKRDVTKGTNNCTIANKILLRIIQKQLELYKGYEIPIEEAGLRKGCGTRDKITNLNES
jgi:hypothetical protein